MENSFSYSSAQTHTTIGRHRERPRQIYSHRNRPERPLRERDPEYRQERATTQPETQSVHSFGVSRITKNLRPVAFETPVALLTTTGTIQVTGEIKPRLKSSAGCTYPKKSRALKIYSTAA